LRCGSCHALLGVAADAYSGEHCGATDWTWQCDQPKQRATQAIALGFARKHKFIQRREILAAVQDLLREQSGQPQLVIDPDDLLEHLVGLTADTPD
jgi:hypothetical protein